jgi:uncharacterized membrane protein YbhN (UPF0104 family)
MTHGAQQGETPETGLAPTGPAGRLRRHRGRHFGLLPRIALGVLLLAIVVFAFLRAHSATHDFLTAFDHFSVGRLPWLALAIGAEVASFLCYALVQRRLLRAGGTKLTMRTMVSLAIAATGITNLVPGGTAPASGWLVGQYRRRCIPMPLAVWVVLAGGFAAIVSIIALLVAGAGVAGLLSWWQALGCGALGFGVAASIVVIVHRTSAVDAWLDLRAGHRWARWVRGLTARAADVVQYRVTVPTGAQVLGLSLANWSMDVFCLIASFEVLGRPIPWHAVLFAYAVAQVAGSLAPVPGGIGFVEGGMVGAFALVGSPAGDALAATVVYRAITCWAVAAIGSVMLVVVERRAAPCAEVTDDDTAQHDAASAAPIGPPSLAVGPEGPPPTSSAVETLP